MRVRLVFANEIWTAYTELGEKLNTEQWYDTIEAWADRQGYTVIFRTEI